MTPNALLEAALQYAGRDWHVFPCKARGKTPLVKGGFKAATTDRAQIEAWWRKWPEANIGLATGLVSGLIVFDLDGEIGISTLQDVAKTMGQVPVTEAVSTGRGWHLYYKIPPDCAAPPRCSSGNGFDVRCEGGYVIAPPSIHENGHLYRWVAM